MAHVHTCRPVHQVLTKRLDGPYDCPLPIGHLARRDAQSSDDFDTANFALYDRRGRTLNLTYDRRRTTNVLHTLKICIEMDLNIQNCAEMCVGSMDITVLESSSFSF